jgi:hypothetical protein
LPVTLLEVQFHGNIAGRRRRPRAAARRADRQRRLRDRRGHADERFFDHVLQRTQWTNNRAVARQAKFAFGGAMGITFGSTPSHTLIAGSQFRGNIARGGDDPRLPTVGLQIASGGAIFVNSPNTTIVDTTLADNTAQGCNSTGVGVPGSAQG